jgi:hypothetical protein
MFRNSTRYNESIETPTTALAPSCVGVKEFVLKYVCNSSNNDCIVNFINVSNFGGQNVALHKIHGISKVALVIRIDGSD